MGTQPLGVKFFHKHIYSVNLMSFAASFPPLNDFVTVSPFKYISDPICACCKIGQGQPRVIIYQNFVELESLMLHAKFQDSTSGSGEEDF